MFYVVIRNFSRGKINCSPSFVWCNWVCACILLSSWWFNLHCFWIIHTPTWWCFLPNHRFIIFNPRKLLPKSATWSVGKCIQCDFKSLYASALDNLKNFGPRALKCTFLHMEDDSNSLLKSCVSVVAYLVLWMVYLVFDMAYLVTSEKGTPAIQVRYGSLQWPEMEWFSGSKFWSSVQDFKRSCKICIRSV